MRKEITIIFFATVSLIIMAACNNSPSTDIEKENVLPNSIDTMKFKNFQPCMFSVSLPTTFKLVPLEDSSLLSLDHCEYQVNANTGDTIVKIYSTVKSRFEYTEISDFYNAGMKNPEFDIKYKIKKDNWFVISGTNKSNGKVFYWKRILGENFLSHLNIEYRKSLASQIEPYITKIATSFTSE